jgi:hypothetical protein
MATPCTVPCDDRRRFAGALLAAPALLLSAAPAWAADAAAASSGARKGATGATGPNGPSGPNGPTGLVVLTISGRIQRPTDGAAAHFDMAALEALPQHEFTTSTPWYPGVRRFSGPLLRDVLAAAGAEGRTAVLIALNDYRVELPIDDAQRFDVIVARLLDGRPMAVRDKGPLFVIYPFDARPELRSAVYHARSAWQLRTIDVR